MTTRPDPARAALSARLQRQMISRRRFLGGTGLVAGGVLLGPTLLAACGSDSGGSGGGGGGTGSEGALRISNWPYYIDEETIPNFQESSGLEVAYTEDINDNEEYFAKIREPLDREQDIGADIFIPTDFLVARLINLGWLAPIDEANVPNRSNLVEGLASPEFDPNRRYSMPWASYLTGLAYNTAESPIQITSMNDLFDPALEGRVTMISDFRDTVGLILMADGVALEDVDEASFTAACDKVAEAKESGQVRRFTGNDYGDDLTSGNAWAAVVYSGDVAQLQLDNPDLEFVFPAEGTVRGTDNMVMPYTIDPAVQAGAEEFINYMYDPENAAKLTAGIQYPSPVQGVGEILAGIEPELADNPLVNPQGSDLENQQSWPSLPEDVEVAYTEQFTEATS